MRIRKNGKFSPVMFLQSTLGPRQTVPKTICQLNQSPWDVIPLSKEICSPSFHQVNLSSLPFGEGDDYCFTGKESFGRSSIGAVQGTEKKRLNTCAEMKGENELKIKRGEKTLHFENKTEGKGSHCINECKEARSICDHHLSKIKPRKRSSGSCLGVAEHFIRKPVTRALKGQTRITNKGHCSSSNGNQLYYYSGLGPWRGKRRERGESDVKETCVPVTVNGAAQNTTPSPIPIIYIDDDSEEDGSDS
ncbi:hypothetical protein SADUNF_Sadunf14G0070600 [Salix dunnii]|uniref:WRC domain-containing protein n=1 Tax=Salix dunnii TaxID=1413687 RepID=A0A835MKH1_9ROSI|nr:hypothetical protein SADUNF_Sadunf14G0070600 [Salix dunnii]